MKILLGIGHPAHVHYFKNFIRIMESKGHDFLIIAKNRNVTFQLLDNLGIKYVKRKDYPKHLLFKLLNIPITDLFYLKHALRYKPDILMGFASAFVAHTGFVLRKPSIVIDDTEHASLSHLSYKSFASVILTPNCFKKDMGCKQIKFKSYMELTYLHPTYFKPSTNIRKELGFAELDKISLVRFVAWQASHDAGHKGVSLENKTLLVKKLSNYSKVIISSEKSLPDELQRYAFRIHPAKMHDVISTCNLVVSEGVTMASEAAILGTPAIYVNSLELGYATEQDEKYGLVYNFKNFDGVIDKAVEIINNDTLVAKSKKAAASLINDHIDLTSFFVWFIENHPKSKQILKENPEYQLKFITQAK